MLDTTHNENSLLINFKHDHGLYTTTRRKSLAFETITQHNSIYGLNKHNNDATKTHYRIYTITVRPMGHVFHPFKLMKVGFLTIKV